MTMAPVRPATRTKIERITYFDATNVSPGIDFQTALVTRGDVPEINAVLIRTLVGIELGHSESVYAEACAYGDYDAKLDQCPVERCTGSIVEIRESGPGTQALVFEDGHVVLIEHLLSIKI